MSGARLFPGNGLSLQLFFVTILPLTLLLLIIAFGSLELHQRAMRSLVGERDERAARTAALAIDAQLRHRGILVYNLAVSIAEGASPEMLLTNDAAQFEDFDAGVAVLARSGQLVATSVDGGLWNTLAERRLVETVADLAATVDERPLFSDAVLDAQTGDYVVFVAAARPNSAVAIGAFSPERLAAPILEGGFAVNDQANAFMVDAHDQILFRTSNLVESEPLSAHAGVANGLSGEEGATFVQTADGEHVVAFSPVAPTGWVLVLSEPWEAVSSPFLRTTLFAPLVLAPVLLMALVALWFGARQIVQPLQRLETQAAALAWGEFEPIEEPVGGTAEIRRLQRELIHLAHKVKLAQQNLRSYIGAITTGQEEERKRLARELHDVTLQSLIALNQRAQLAQMGTTSPEVSRVMADIQQLTGQSIADLRRFVRALRPIYLEDLGLATALEMLLKETGETTGMKTGFQQWGSPQRLPATCELALYRMAQEAVSNVIRHAEGQAVYIMLGFGEQSDVTLTIIDDGRGFTVPDNPAEFASAGHFGLLGLQERAELIGATLTITSERQRGTEITIYLK
ncbi:MAG: hypothetical protein J5I90_22060 [Caldilineales bacterium]|nr:hypothetical protein [Caldilineales bacterium]